MPYYGKPIMQRDLCALVVAHWPNQKIKGTATFIAESHLYVGALHDNFDEHGTWVSRDCGLPQISIPVSQVGTEAEFSIRTDSLDPTVYWPVARASIKAAYQKWNEPMNRPAGQPQKRLWQPWVAYRYGWATFPEFWVWSRLEDGTPGPWVPTGRYLHQAIRGVANWHLLVAKDMSEWDAVAWAEKMASDFGVTQGYLTYDARHGVYWIYPPKPTEPPTGGVGAWPVKNDGR